MSGILSLMLIVPLAAALICLFVNANQARWIALGATLIDLALGGVLWANFEIGGAQWQFVEYTPIFGRFAWALGIDGFALLLILLSVFLMPICILASWDSITKRVGEYMSAFLLMEVLMIGVFAAQEIKPQARTLAQDRGIECVVLDYDRMRGIDDAEFRLF